MAFRLSGKRGIMRQHLLDYINDSKSHSVRGLRILLEYFYALEVYEPLHDRNLHVVSVFGSARSQPNQPEYKGAVKLGKALYEKGFSVVTGASQGIMEAANKGVADGLYAEFKKLKKYKNKSREEIQDLAAYRKKLDKYSLGLKISLPFEAEHNPHLGTVATFHYFMVRKFFFAALSSAFIACEGGWGTRDELFEVMTLVQTGKMPLMPIIYVTSQPGHFTQDLKFAVKNKYISPEDMSLIQVVSDYKKAVKIIDDFYKVVKWISYDRKPYVDVHLVKPLTPAQKKKVQTLVDKKYKHIFVGGVEFTKTRMAFKDCVHKSYGILREVIDAVS